MVCAAYAANVLENGLLFLLLLLLLLPVLDSCLILHSCVASPRESLTLSA